MNSGKMNLKLASALRIILIVVGVLLLGYGIFITFKIRTEAKHAFRDAKNIRLALMTADIEYYAQNKTVYSAYKPRGLEDGVEEEVAKFSDAKGVYAITSYDYKSREITGIRYDEGRYRVTFKKSGDDLAWKVDYLFTVYNFADTD